MKINPITNNYQSSFKAKLSPEVEKGLGCVLNWGENHRGLNNKITREERKNIGYILTLCPNDTVDIGRNDDNPSTYDYIIKNDEGVRIHAGCKAWNKEDLFWDSFNLEKLIHALTKKSERDVQRKINELRSALWVENK